MVDDDADDCRFGEGWMLRYAWAVHALLRKAGGDSETPPIERLSAGRPGRASPRNGEINAHGSLGCAAQGMDDLVVGFGVIQL